MLEVKHLRRVYKIKNAQSVYALDDVSLKFPETGLIFILGKSGSGKSTLLNVMGGLDEADEGEIIINGKSSKAFSKGEMDSYRNTYLGFIFQEYNILSDFTVKENIALALQLQHKKATDEAIEHILQEVDLGGYGKRKPNELSGGQKQRVAIARALVKEPQIIFGDEPTGALDSNTGKQVFETLKKLSKSKLVIIVSHDRDFAEHFGDRVIELRDGKVISDITKTAVESVKPSTGLSLIGDNIIRISKGRSLTEKDLPLINKAIARGQGEVYISADSHVNDALCEAAKIDDNGNREEFIETDPTQIKEGTGLFKAIKSKFSLKNAFRMGAKSLRVKPFRLVMTILLSTVSFSMFGASMTLSLFNSKEAVKSTIERNQLSAVTVNISGKKCSPTFSDEVKQEIETKTGVKLYSTNSISTYLNTPTQMDSDQFHTFRLSRSLEVSDTILNDFQISLAYGSMPKSEYECAISLYSYYTFEDFGIGKNKYDSDYVPSSDVTMSKVVGTRLVTGSSDSGSGDSVSYTITGIIDTHVPSKLLVYRNSTSTLDYTHPDASSLSALRNDDSIHNILFVGKGEREKTVVPLNFSFYGGTNETKTSLSVLYSRSADDNAFYFDETKTSLAKDEALLSLNTFTYLDYTSEKLTTIDQYSFEGAYLSSMPSDGVYSISNTARSDALYKSIYKAAAYKTKYDKYQDFYQNHLDIAKRINEGDDPRSSINAITDFDYQNATKEQQYQLFASYFNGYVVTEQYDIDKSNEYYQYYLSVAKSYEDALKKDYPPLIGDAIEEINYSFEIAIRNYVDEHYMEIYNNHKNDGDLYLQDAWSERDKKQAIYDYLIGVGQYSGECIEIQKSFLAKKKELLRAVPSFTELVVKGTLPVGSSENPYQEVSFRVVGFELFGSNNESRLFVSKETVDFLNQKIAENGYYSYGQSETVFAAFGSNKGARDAFLDYYFSKKPTDYDKTPNGTWWLSFKTRAVSNAESISSIVVILTQVFLYVGIAFAIFSMLLFYNFMSVSINNKKREIGILRAVGAKRSDVFKIFYSEAFMIATVNFVLSTAVVLIVSSIVNDKFTQSIYFDFTIMNPNAFVVIGLFAIALVASFVSSLLPVTRIANKKPIDAIQNR